MPLCFNTNGSLVENPQIINHQGSSINKSRQEKPHVHSTKWAPNQKDLFVVDLGIDKIMKYKLVNGKLKTGTPEYTEIAQGSGPRHLTYHPNGKFVYVIQELSSQISTLIRTLALGVLATSWIFLVGGRDAPELINSVPKHQVMVVAALCIMAKVPNYARCVLRGVLY